MKRPRIALCLLMALFATSLYAVGFAADRDNLAGRYGAADWAAEEADLCEYAYEGYCEYAYDRPAAYPYDGCTAVDDDSANATDDSYQAYSSDIDELEAAPSENEEVGLSDVENASLEAAAIDYEDSYAFGSEYSDDLAESPEPEEFDKAAWCGRYCLAREEEPAAAESLPAGSIRDFVESVSDSLVQLLSQSSAWQLDAAAQRRSQVASGLGLLEGADWSAANSAVAAGANRWVVVDSVPLAAGNVGLLISPPAPVTLRDLARPLARLAIGVRNHWQQAWSEMGDLAAEGDEVPEISSRPQSESANPPSDPGRDTRTSQRRNPRRVEI